MKLRITFDFDTRARRALSHTFGDKEPASRERIICWIESVVGSTIGDLVYEFDRDTGAGEGGSR